MTQRPDAELCAALCDAWDEAPTPTPTYYEPWTPTIEQVVRLHLSHECRKQFYRNGDLSRTVGHKWLWDGKFGVIEEIRRAEIGPLGLPADGHFYRVRGAWGRGWFAAAELIPLSDDAATDSGDGAS